MPKYQYRCADCGADLEVHQKFTDDAITVCPECGGELKKVFSAVGVVFKGSGFYKTDNRAKPGGASDRSESKPESKGETKAEQTSSSENKPKKSETPAAS